MSQPPGPDLTQLQAKIDEANLILRVDAGGIELVSIAGGEVTIRFTGLCVACPSKPLTTASTIKPLLMEASGVTRVTVLGARISREGEHGIVASLRRAASVAQESACEAGRNL